MSATFESLEAVLNSLQKPPAREDTFTIALGDYFEGSEAVLTFWKLKASLLFGDTLANYVHDIKLQRCKEDEAVILEMAVIIASHKEPPAENPGKLIPAYINIFSALSEPQKWQFVQEFKQKGGQEFMNKMAAVLGQKKSDTEEKSPVVTTEDDTKS